MPGDNFRVEFDPCSALRHKCSEQKTNLQDMIAYNDALRNGAYEGDKVLAPFMNDGKYVPATIVEGVDSRKTRRKGLHSSFENYLSCRNIIAMT